MSIRIPSILLALALVGCDGKDSTGDDTSTTDVPADTVEDTATDDAPTDVPADTATDAPDDPTCMLPEVPCATSEQACHETPCTPPVSPTCMAGHVVDEAGDPIYCQGVVACAGGACFPGKSDEDGFFAIDIPATGISHLGLYFPGSPPRHTPFCRFDDLCDGPNHLCDPFVLRLAPTTGTAVPEPPGLGEPPPPLTEDVRIEAADTAAVILPAGAELKLPIGAEYWMALTRYPLDEDVPCFVDPENLPLALYVVTPYDTLVIEEGTRIEPVLINAALDLPNTTSLPADTVLDVYVVGGVHPDHADLEEGQWMPLTTATVTTDGTRIQTADGDGLGYLTWFGIYPAS